MLLQMQEQTGMTPKALSDKPTLSEHLAYGWNLFHELSEIRPPPGYSTPSPIPLSEFMAHAALWQIGRVEAQELWRLVRCIDRLWLREIAERQKAADAKTKTRAASPKHVP